MEPGLHGETVLITVVTHEWARTPLLCPQSRLLWSFCGADREAVTPPSCEGHWCRCWEHRRPMDSGCQPCVLGVGG